MERTFGWFGRYRRLSKDYETNPRSSEAWILIAMIHRMALAMLPNRLDENRLENARNVEIGISSGRSQMPYSLHKNWFPIFSATN